MSINFIKIMFYRILFTISISCFIIHFMNKKRGPQGLILFAKRSLTPFVWMPLLSFATLGILLLQPGRSASADSPQPPVQNHTSIQKKPVVTELSKTQSTPQVAVQAAAPTPQATAKPAAAVATTSYCRVAAFGDPSPILAESSAVGVTIITDPPAYYVFRGGTTNSNTIAEATRCARQQPALGGQYHGLTARTIKYAYAIKPVDDTICRVDAVRVTLHQAVLLPQADMEGLPAGAASQWQTTAGKLQAHEYEHVVINRTHVQQIYDQLAVFTGPCNNIDSLASGVAEQNIANMNAANQALDTETNHGTR